MLTAKSCVAWNLALTVVAGITIGCAAGNAQPVDTEPGDDSEGALTGSSAKVVGVYAAESSDRPPTFRKLDLRDDATFEADVDTGIRCIVAPCPSNDHLVGTFSATRTSLTLKPKSGEQATQNYGRYTMKLTDNAIELTRNGDAFWNGWSNKLTKQTQDPHRCMGAWRDQNNICRTPADGVYPDDCCASTEVKHYAATNVELEWAPGCGVAPGCYSGLLLTFTKAHRDLKAKSEVSVDASHRKLTVKLDTSSEGASTAPAGEPETEQLGHPNGLSMGTTYSAKVVDNDGNELWHGQIRPMMAP